MFIAVDHACVGMRRGEEYDFFLPDAVANIYIDSCDAEWSVDVSSYWWSQIDPDGSYVIVVFPYNSVFYFNNQQIIISIVI